MDFRTIPPIGQAHENACWAASLTWWLKALAGTGRPSWTQDKVMYEFARGTDENGAMRDIAMMNGWRDDKRLKMAVKLRETPPEEFVKDFRLGNKPVCIAYQHPSGFAHMNVIWPDGPDFLMCMEPFHPHPGENGKRTGRVMRKEYIHFNCGERVLLAWAKPSDGRETEWPADAD